MCPRACRKATAFACGRAWPHGSCSRSWNWTPTTIRSFTRLSGRSPGGSISTPSRPLRSVALSPRRVPFLRTTGCNARRTPSSIAFETMRARVRASTRKPLRFAFTSISANGTTSSLSISQGRHCTGVATAKRAGRRLSRKTSPRRFSILQDGRRRPAKDCRSWTRPAGQARS